MSRELNICNIRFGFWLKYLFIILLIGMGGGGGKLIVIIWFYFKLGIEGVLDSVKILFLYISNLFIRIFDFDGKIL